MPTGSFPSLFIFVSGLLSCIFDVRCRRRPSPLEGSDHTRAWLEATSNCWHVGQRSDHRTQDGMAANTLASLLLIGSSVCSNPVKSIGNHRLGISQSDFQNLKTRNAPATRMHDPQIPPGQDQSDVPETKSSHKAWARRQVTARATIGMLGAEAAWRKAVDTAAVALETASAEQISGLLPLGTIEEIESGRVVVLKNWLPSDELAALRADALACFAGGSFKADGLAVYGKQKKAGDFDASRDRTVMPSFFPSTGADGPWVDSTIGNFAARQRFKMRMAEVKALLSRQLYDRPTLAEDLRQSHEMSYSRYGPGASLARHTDEHHPVLRKASQKATRRSISWLVYLNDAWDAEAHGGELRVHGRSQPPSNRVGADGANLQVGWLRATSTHKEQPVFLDARRTNGDDCYLYVWNSDGSHRDLSRKPFTSESPALKFAGDLLARKMLIDDPSDAERFHLLDKPKAPISDLLPPVGPEGEDGGERIRDISPEGGTLVLFDSVSVPHEVLPTRQRERFALSGWFHEKIRV